MRLIDAESLKERKFKNPISYNAFVKLIDREPTVEAEPVKHGRWELHKHRIGKAEEIAWYQCSVCGHKNWAKG